MMKKSWTITTPKGDEGILDDYYSKKVMKESWTITAPKGGEGILDDYYSKS